MADLATKVLSASHRDPMAPFDAAAYAVLATATMIIPVALAHGVPGSSPIGVATMVATVLSAAWLTLPSLLGIGVDRRDRAYPENVVASVSSADVVGFRSHKGRSWTVRFADGAQQVMSEYEFQDVVNSASEERKVAAVQRIGASIYVQHLADGPFEGKRSRTEIFHCSGSLAA